MNNVGWICARCGVSLAPHVDRCACIPGYYHTLYPYLPSPYLPIWIYNPITYTAAQTTYTPILSQCINI